MENEKISTNEIIYETGALFSPVDVRDYRLACVGNDSEFPEEFELKMGKIKNQGAVGSCVAHSIAETIEHFNIKQNNDLSKMSISYIYGNRDNMNHTGKGMYTRKAVANACKYGDVYESDCPGNIEVPEVIDNFESIKDELYDKGIPHRFSSYYSVKTKNEIKTALMQNGPVIFAMEWYDDIKVVDGVIQTSQQGEGGGHCMVIYGWNKQGWKIQNSWGSHWGNKGTAILPYDVKIREAYGIVDNITNEVDVIKPYNSILGKFIAKILNYLINRMQRYIGDYKK